MKGQFFIAAAVMICMLFFLGMPLAGTDIRASAEKDMRYLAENLKTELPHALNLGLKENLSTACLVSFTRFADSVLSGKRVDFRGFWVVSKGGDATSVSYTHLTLPTKA